MVKTKDLYSTYCPTGGCIYTPSAILLKSVTGEAPAFLCMP